MQTAWMIILLGIETGAVMAEAATPAEFIPSTQGKKLISYGWDNPTTAFVRRNIRAMEQSPLHGVVLRISKIPGQLEVRSTEDELGWQAFSPVRFQPEQYEHALADLQATRFTTMTDNFVGLHTMPGIDFADEESWAATLHNCRILARIARQGGCVGVQVDAERYNPIRMWCYEELPPERRQQFTRPEYEAFMRSRGAELMRVFNDEFPAIKLLFFFGPSAGIGGQDYELLVPFVEGLCRVATPGTQIIDAREQTYGLRDEAGFKFHRHAMAVETREAFEDKLSFDQVMRFGFAAWLDCWGHWNPAQPEENFYLPGSWQTTLHYALKHADEYV